MRSLIDDKKAVITVAAGHGRRTNPETQQPTTQAEKDQVDRIEHYPAHFAVDGTFSQIILVGGSDKNGRRAPDCPNNAQIDTWAPNGPSIVAGPNGDADYPQQAGTSLGEFPPVA